MKKAVLLIDDEQNEHKFFLFALRKLQIQDDRFKQIEVHFVKTSDEAFECLKVKNIDLVWTDNQLSNSKLNGHEIVRSIKETYPLLPVLIWSHNINDKNLQAVADIANELIEKPRSLDDEETLIKTMIHKFLL